MHREPDVGFDPGSPGSRPEPKAGTKPLSHPGIPGDFPSSVCIHISGGRGFEKSHVVFIPCSYDVISARRREQWGTRKARPVGTERPPRGASSLRLQPAAARPVLRNEACGAEAARRDTF